MVNLSMIMKRGIVDRAGTIRKSLNFDLIDSFVDNLALNGVEYVFRGGLGDWKEQYWAENLKEAADKASAKGLPFFILVERSSAENVAGIFGLQYQGIKVEVLKQANLIPQEYKLTETNKKEEKPASIYLQEPIRIIGEEHTLDGDISFAERLGQLASRELIVLGLEGIAREEKQEESITKERYGLP